MFLYFIESLFPGLAEGIAVNVIFFFFIWGLFVFRVLKYWEFEAKDFYGRGEIDDEKVWIYKSVIKLSTLELEMITRSSSW